MSTGHWLAATGGPGGWVELGRTTLGSTADAINVTSLADKRYLMILTHIFDSGQTNLRYNFNSDTGSNYAKRQSINGGSSSTGSSESNIGIVQDNADDDRFQVGYVSNLAAQEKLMINHAVERGNNSGANNAPARVDTVGKWANTSNAISAVNISNDATGDYESGAECVVLGYDPTDTHLTNFWEELASVDLSGGVSDTLSSGTFTAKKYLWVQCYLNSNSTTPTSKIRVGNSTVDSGTNYAERYSVDGAADGTVTSIDELDAGVNIDTGESEFHNMFIINNASNEKLMIHHRVGNNAGTGAANAPSRRENVFKWANTSNQINILQFKSDSGTYATNSILKVWGSD